MLRSLRIRRAARQMETLHFTQLAAPARELVALGARDALRALTRHEDSHVRECAYGALGEIATPADIPIFVTGLSDFELMAPEICSEILAAMGTIAVPALQAAARDPDQAVREWAAEALDSIRDRG